MDNFEEYLIQGEPDKAEKAKIWKTAIGLQQVDGLKPSEYLLQTARQHIEGDITIEEVKQRIDAYYEQHPTKRDEDRTEEADKVSARVTEILNEQAFTFSPAGYLAIHRRLFHGIYKHAGKIRDYNITKKEWVLDGETVLYGSADSLKETLEYDLRQEKQFSYRGLSQHETIDHVAQFISYLWQIHVFGEGNTRTTAIFLIKYLRTLGFHVTNELFEQHSWYFRNALVRANYENNPKGILATREFLLRFFGNLLLGEKNTLKNRDMHVRYLAPVKERKGRSSSAKSGQKPVVRKGGQKTSSEILRSIKEDPKITRSELVKKLEINPSAIQKHIAKLKAAGIIERVGGDKGGHWKINAPTKPR